MARRFRFRLETVRKLRERARDAQRRVVADAVRDVNGIEKLLAQLDQQLRGTIDRARGIHEERRLDVTSLRGHQFYRGWLHRKILESTVELAARKTRLEAERDKLGEASKRLNRARDILREHGNYAYLNGSGSIVKLNSGIEFAAIYFSMLLALVIIGGGRYLSLDYYLGLMMRSRQLE